MMCQLLVALIFIFCLACTGVSSQCTKAGRFLNDASPNCQGYSMCISNGNDVYIQYNLTCPTTFVFSPIDKVCSNSTTFRCNNINFDCNQFGYFENMNSPDCSSYIACVEGLNKILPIEVSCAFNTVYNPSTFSCVNTTEFNCIRVPDTQGSTSSVSRMYGDNIFVLVLFVSILTMYK